jgi:5'-nucleotidase (lipoprotein e(P4) family)
MELTNKLKARKRRLGLTLYTVTLFLIPLGQQSSVAAQERANNEYQEGAILWTQTSGERNALAYQAFALARMMLDRDLSTRHGNRTRRAVIVDIDETVIDNSSYQAMLLKTHQNYNSQNWTEWVNRVESTAIPGAVEFLRHAASHGVRIFYISNRKTIEKPATILNLKKLGFPDISEQTVLVQTNPQSSNKEDRRQLVSKQYRIVLLMGDNLNDFADVFEKSKTVADRLASVEQNKSQFGKRFIVLPNPMYGDWENAIYDYNFKLSEKEKAAKRAERLKSN